MNQLGMKLPAIQPNQMPEASMSDVGMQLDAAHRYPRSLDNFVDNCLSLAVINQETAMGCIYCRPVGRNKKTGIQTFATGPSVRLAEIMTTYYTNIRVISRIVPTGNPDVIKVQGLAWDLEQNVQRGSEIEANVAGWSMPQRDVKKKAMSAIAARDAILQVIPRAFADEIKRRILEKCIGNDLNTAWEQVVEGYKGLGITEEQILKAVDVEQVSDLRADDIQKAVGIYNYLVDSKDDINYIFGTQDEKKTNGPQRKPVTTAPKSKKDVKTKEAIRPQTQNKPAQGQKPVTPAKPPQKPKQPIQPQGKPIVMQNKGEKVEKTAFEKEVAEICGYLGVDPMLEIQTKFGISHPRAVPAEKQEMILHFFKQQLQE